jgi:hypothetical protein
LADFIERLPPSERPLALRVVQEEPLLQERFATSEESSYTTFRPRPDKPAQFDEQSGFCFNRDRVSFLIGGNAAGTTEAAAFKAARFMLRQQPPPRKDTPFWIISNTYEQVCGVCWGEKLLGHAHIPDHEIEWDRIRWIDTRRGWPSSVPLKPWDGYPDRNWCLEFKSYVQGRTAMQARSIGGFWFSEQFPTNIFTEVMRGAREYMFPGGQFAEFTPVEPELCLYIEKLLEKTPPGWRFYRCNTELNKANLAAGWLEDFLATVPDEMVETRLTGALASFEGVIFSSFHPAVHVISGKTPIPPGVHHYTGIDWGASEEHPFVCVWGYRDGIGDWVIYDEYWSTDQSRITLDHHAEIVERSRQWGWPGKWAEHKAYGRKWEAIPTGLHHEAVADPSRPGEINEFNERGWSTGLAATGVYKGIDCIRSLLKVRPPEDKPKLFIHDRCKHLIEEIRKYRWKRGKRPGDGTVLNPQVAAPEPLKRDDDTVDAMRYMIYTAEIGRGAAPGSMSHREFAERRSVQLRKPTEARSPGIGEGWFSTE